MSYAYMAIESNTSELDIFSSALASTLYTDSIAVYTSFLTGFDGRGAQGIVSKRAVISHQAVDLSNPTEVQRLGVISGRIRPKPLLHQAHLL